MMTFTRNRSPRWHDEVPGARWFRADLHLHTLDDHSGGRLSWPTALGGRDPFDPDTRRLYARKFLRAAIQQGLEVLGLTPHAVRVGPGDAPSATWEIVRTWNEDDDDDGVPFRDKIYAVFPGFEPSFTSGKKGAHLIFLFDPEVGQNFFLSAFSVVMNGATPWRDGDLQNSTRTPEDAFRALDGLFERERIPAHHHLVLAPHAFSGKGILNTLAGQVAGDFPWPRISALELPDNATAEELIAEKPWLEPKLNELRHGLFHSTDAYALAPEPRDGEDPCRAGPGELGHRMTLLKLACPMISGLRQAFLGRESRVRLIYVRSDDGQLVESDDLPNPLGNAHPWIRSVRVTGGQSFFGGGDRSDGVEFRLSPSLNCIIGGRMSGKSTFLDGLRVHLGADLPVESAARVDVEGRARKRFLLGDPDVQIQYGGTAAPGRWPAKFFTQRELQEAVKDQRGLREILFHLAPAHTDELISQQTELTQLDRELTQMVGAIAELRTDSADAGQALQEAQEAMDALSRYEEAGANRLADLQTQIGRVASYRRDLDKVGISISDALNHLRKAEFPEGEDEQFRSLLPLSAAIELRAEIRHVDGHLTSIATDLDGIASKIEALIEAGHAREIALKDEITASLVAAGGSREELIDFDRHQKKAAEYEVLRTDAVRVRGELDARERSFMTKVDRRRHLVERHRELIQELASAVNARFGGQIQVRLEHEAVLEPLERWIRDLKQKGVTRWWNSQVESGNAPGGTELYRSLTEGNLDDLGMSGDVARTFMDMMVADTRNELCAVRCPDRYVLEFRVSADPLEFREMGELSGGQQVSLLLTLLLEAEDDRPLVIDQPEDELDSEYLFGTILPVLRDLKGRRQIIFATHDANIVVNGDADHVLCLEADHRSGRVRTAGAIEVDDVRRAIIDTVDGGAEAFQLRRRKYGF